MSFVTIELGPDIRITDHIINRILGKAPDEVRKAVSAYAMGNPGAARVLAERSVEFVTAGQVTELIGWSLDEHILDRTGDIWDRFKDV